MFGFQQSRPFNTIKRLSRLTPGVIFSPIIENSDQAIIIAKNLPSGVTLSLDQTEPDPIVAAIADHILSGQTIICNNKPIYDQINAIRLMRRLLANGEFDINLIQSPQGAASSAGAGISASSSSQAGAADERTPVQLSADKVLELKGKDTTHQAIVSGMKNFDIVTISHSLTQAALAQIGQQTQGKHTLMLSPGIKKSQLEQIVTNLTPSNPTLWFHEFKGNSQWTLFEHNDFEHNDLEYIFALLTNVTIKLDCDHHKGKDLNSLLQRLKNENNITFAPIVSKASQAKIIGENLPNKVKLKLERGEISLEAAKSIAMNIGSDHAIICDEAQIFTAMRDILNSRTTDDPAFTFHITSIKNSSNPEASSRAQSPFFNPSKKTRLGASEEREDDEDTTKQASPMSHA